MDKWKLGKDLLDPPPILIWEPLEFFIGFSLIVLGLLIESSLVILFAVVVLTYISKIKRLFSPRPGDLKHFMYTKGFLFYDDKTPNPYVKQYSE